MPEFRTGGNVGRTIYRNGELVGLMDTRELADLTVRALTAYTTQEPGGRNADVENTEQGRTSVDDRSTVQPVSPGPGDNAPGFGDDGY